MIEPGSYVRLTHVRGSFTTVYEGEYLGIQQSRWVDDGLEIVLRQNSTTTASMELDGSVKLQVLEARVYA